MRPRYWIAIVAAGILLGATFVLGATFWWAGRDTIIEGVKIRETALQGLGRDAGMAAIKELEKEILARPAVLKCREKTWELPLGELNFRLEAGEMIDTALRLGKEGSFFEQWRQRNQIKEHGYELPLIIGLDKKKFIQKVTEVTSGLGYPPEDASFQITPDDRVEVIPGKEGLQVDAEGACRELLDQLGKGGAGPQINLRLAPVEPRRTTAAVAAMGVKGLLSSYATAFDAKNVGRTYNIRVAAAALDGLLAPPGQEVSFNEVVGPRSSDAGYKNAKVIINNEFVEGIGGGVCQVSSTLYNAILLANLEILDRTNHSLPVAYVPAGRDATVVYGAIDLKFRNNTESYIYVRSAVKGGQLTFKIYGNTDYKAPVTIRTKVIKEIEPKVIYQKDPLLKKGEQIVKQEGAKGYKVITERVIWENNKAQIEILPPSDYQPVDKIIVQGTKEEKEVPVFLPPGAGEKKPSDEMPPGSGGKRPADEKQPPPAQPPPIPPAGEKQPEAGSLQPPAEKAPGTGARQPPAEKTPGTEL